MHFGKFQKNNWEILPTQTGGNFPTQGFGRFSSPTLRTARGRAREPSSPAAPTRSPPRDAVLLRRLRLAVRVIGLLAVLANGVWWVVLDYLRAFFWATIFHGLQYLVIADIFHIRDQTALPENRRGPLYHAGRFYLLSLALGYGLFYCWPYAFVLTGFGLAESVLLVAAAINIHHFIVDARIWRLAPGDGNRAITAT